MIWHRQIGDGPTKVIVIHGWFWDHRICTPMFDYLDTRRFSYALPDIRGYGNSRDVTGDYTIAEVAADAIALADRLGWREFHVVGHSMGGKAAQKVAIDAGARVRSVVAITPVPAFAMPVDDATFGFFSAACTQDDVARALIGGLGRQPPVGGVDRPAAAAGARYCAAGGLRRLHALVHSRRPVGGRRDRQGADAGARRTA